MRHYFIHADRPLPERKIRRKVKIIDKAALRAKIARMKAKYAHDDMMKRREYSILKLEVFQAYGGKCVCCAESNSGFLTIDHINRDGKGERNNFYRMLKAKGFPKDRYRLYCINCNWGSRRDGVCPHERQRIAAAVTK